MLTGTHAGFFLAGVWGTAMLGASLIILGPARLKWPEPAALPRLGWAGALVGGPMLIHALARPIRADPRRRLVYTAGLFFFLWERLPFHNTIWHVFVLAATFVLYAAVVLELSGRAPV